MKATLLTGTCSHKAIHATVMVGLCLAIWLTYRPALKHGARDDQWNFLTDTRNQRHFKRLILRHYAYNRTSEMARGDYPLFRPVLYALLAGEKAFFGHRFLGWQAVGIIVHCAIVCLLLTLLLRLDRLGSPGEGSTGLRLRTVAAYGLALFFAVDVSIMELVIYHHLTGYLVFLLLELGVMVLVVDLLADANSSVRVRLARIGGAFVLALLAAFTYEIGQLFAVVVGLVLGAAAWRAGKRRQGVALAGLFCLVLVLFQLADRGHRLLHPPQSQDLGESTILAVACSPTTLINAGRYLAFCLVQPFFPSCVDVGFASRLIVPEPRDSLANFMRLDPLLGVSLLVVAGVGVLTAIGFRRLGSDPSRGPRLMVVLLAVALVVLHMSIIVLGRMNMRPRPTILSMNSYYAYFPLAMLLVGLYALWSSAPAAATPRRERLAGVLQMAVVAGLLVLSVASARKVHAMNVEIRNVHRPLRNCITFLDDLVREHGTDTGVSVWRSHPRRWSTSAPLHRDTSFRDRYRSSCTIAIWMMNIPPMSFPRSMGSGMLTRRRTRPLSVEIPLDRFAPFMRSHVFPRLLSRRHRDAALKKDQRNDHLPNSLPNLLLWRRDRLPRLVPRARRGGSRHDHRQVLLPHLPLSPAVFRAPHSRRLS